MLILIMNNSNCMNKYHPAAKYICPTNNQPILSNKEALARAYSKNKFGGNFCNKKVTNMGQNHACKPFDCPSMSELAWTNRNRIGVTTTSWPKINGGGYYNAVGETPIGGKAPIGTYPNCCPPVFCSKLTGGKKGRQSSSKYHKLGHGLFEIEKLISHLKKKDLSKLLHKFVAEKKDIYNIYNYHHHFDKKLLRTLASTLLLDTYLNGKTNNISTIKLKSINKILKNKSQSTQLLSYLNEFATDNFTSLKQLNKLHSGGAYPATYYPLGYYIAPVGANIFTAAAIVFLMSMLYKLNNKKTKLVGGSKITKKSIIADIKKLIKPLHNFKYTKKTISDLGKFTIKVKKKASISRKKAKRNYIGGSLLNRGIARQPGAFSAFSEINPAPICYDMSKNLRYKPDITETLETTPLSQENVGEFLKKNNIYGGIGGRKKNIRNRNKKIRKKKKN